MLKVFTSWNHFFFVVVVGGYGVKRDGEFVRLLFNFCRIVMLDELFFLYGRRDRRGDAATKLDDMNYLFIYLCFS